MTVRVVVADDHGIVREGLRALLTAAPGFEVVETAANGDDAIRAVVTRRPDVLILDIQMPGRSGIEVAREVVRAAPNVGILMLTMFDDDESVFAAMRAGALGYVLKGAEADDVLRAVNAVAAGEAIFGPAVARRALSYLSNPRSATPLPELTARERDVLHLIAAGLTNPAIATRLGLAPNTVSNHISSIFAKLQVTGRAEAISRARSAGLGRDRHPLRES